MSSLHGSRPTFIGRVDEIAQLRAGLDNARSRRGGLVLVSGPPGIGKSRLTAEFTAEATEAGVRVLVGRSWEAGGAPPYWPWIQAIRGYMRSTEPDVLVNQIAEGAAGLAAIFPEIRDLIPATGSSPTLEPIANRFLLFDATASFLCNVGHAEPLVIVLDDLQAADAPTLLMLEFVTGQIADSGVLVVATFRDVELTPEHPLTRALAELRRSPQTSEMTLRGLDADEVARFLEVNLGAATVPTFASNLHRQTSGNPLFLGEAVRLLETTTGGENGPQHLARVTIPAEVRAVIERRLEVLSSECRTILESVSVLGNDFDVKVAARLVDAHLDEVLDQAGEAMTAGLLIEARAGPGTFGFAHDLIRHALYEGLAPAQRTRLHRHSAEILEDAYGSQREDHLAELALHHFESVVGGDSDKAVIYGRRAGEQALRRFAYEEAVRLFETSLQVLEGSEEHDQDSRAELLLLLGDARVRAGDFPGAASAFLEAAEDARGIGDARLMALAAVNYGGRFVWARAGDDERMIPLLQDALMMLGGQDDELRVRLLSRLACASRSTGNREHGAALARQSVELARQIGDPATLAYALSGLAGAIWWPETSAERLELGAEMVSLSETSGGMEGAVDGHMTRCAAFAELADFAGARRELDLLAHAGGPLRLKSQRWLEEAMRSVFALSDGVFDQVEMWTEDMLNQAPISHARDTVSATVFQRFLLRREQKRLLEVEESVRQAALEFTWYPIHRLALADLFMRTNRSADARSILEELASGGFAAFDRDNYWLPSMCLAAELVTALDDQEKAAVLIDLMTPFASLNAIAFPEGSMGVVDRYLGLLAGVIGNHDAAEAWFESALALSERHTARPMIAHIHYDWGKALLNRGDAADLVKAQEHFQICASLCDSLELTALRDAVDASGAPPSTALSRSGSGANSASFRREGEYFSIVFEDADFKIKDVKGMRHLALLLATPGREIHVMDLLVGEGGVDAGARGSKPEDGPTTPHQEPSEAILDREARKSYERRLLELQEDIDEAHRFNDQVRAATARGERDFLVEELTAAVGLGGRDRFAITAAERARVNVTRAIRSAVARLASQSPLLGTHLDTTIRTGTFCSYNPDPLHPIHWSL